MNKKRKILLIAIFTSAILTVIITGLTYMNNRQTELPDSEAFLMEDIVDDVPYVPYRMLGVISIACFVVLTLVFYFIVSNLNKLKSE